MHSKTPDDLLYESEAALRLVDSALSEIEEASDDEIAAASQSSAIDLSSAAVTDILSGIESATKILDELDVADEAGHRERSRELRVALRDELLALTGHMHTAMA